MHVRVCAACEYYVIVVFATPLQLSLATLEIDVDFSTAPPIRNVELADALLRCTQEGITNVLRHSDATKCQIAIGLDGDKCVLTVTDNGKPGEEIEPGNGLKGMTERVGAIGGQISW